jgi:hypothetical protein
MKSLAASIRHHRDAFGFPFDVTLHDSDRFMTWDRREGERRALAGGEYPYWKAS